MIIERLEAVSFGPFEAEVYEFAPGMTVVFGPNEAGKSSLHAALYAGLCGIRRGRGQPRVEDREFHDRHHPWDGSDWRVSLRIRLADGRRIDLQQDLAGRVACRATDDLGRDVTGEIVHEGSPDGSRWLGLTRQSFLATACVRQAELVRVADDPGALQEELQRAAASAGRDATAAAAIDRLRAFRSEHVGLDRVNSRRPLRKAKTTLEERRRLLEAARAEHSRVLLLLVGVEERQAEVEEAASKVQLLEAALAVRDARARQEELTRIEELASQVPEEPALLSDDADLARDVSQALARWESAPPEPDLSGSTASALEGELAALPEMPLGDLEVHRDVRAAFSEHDGASRALRVHEQTPPDPVPADRSPDVPDEELHRLVEALKAQAPDLDPSLDQRVTHAREAYEGAQRPKLSRPAIGVGAALAITGGIAALFMPIPAAVLVVVGLVILGWGLVTARSGRDKLSALKELRDAEIALGEERHRIETVRRNRQSATERLTELGVEATPDAVSSWIDERGAAAAARHATGEWSRRKDELRRGVDQESARLRSALVARGEVVGEDVADAFRQYEAACRTRAETATTAGRKAELDAQLAARNAADDAASRRRAALQGLRDTGDRLDMADQDPAEITNRLRAWLARRSEALMAHEAHASAWTELQTLLGGRTIDDVRAGVEERRRQVNEASGLWDPHGLEGAVASSDLEGDLSTATELHTEAVSRAGIAQGEALSAAGSAPGVPDTEEALTRAEVELARVLTLDNTLETTLHYLERAQDRVHRDIAPVLRDTIVAWLPRVTAGRYEDVTVDPQSLGVRVLRTGGELRDVARLSHGTCEQIYLLLRLALAEHLVEAPERAPLLFDEVTAHCDAVRREAILELLHDFSVERQVIVFTHEDVVREWADEALATPRDRLVLREALVG